MKTVLLVDDEPANLDLLRLIVDEAGLPVCVVTAVNGAEAVERARSTVPDLVLMDLMMPVLDGWEATRRLKANRATAGIPVIALTALAMPGDREAALAAGCDDYLTKPVDVTSLIALLRERLA